ncbi:MAG TPA: sensor histidine kinase [Solirubrobacterales bacterium]|nr:sensor histidine kinase [Solirubrobacterales bacterium]
MSAPVGDFVHRALIYGSDQEFMDVALPFVADGLNSGQQTLVSVQDRHIENLQAALGGTPEGLTLHPVEDWHETAARTRDKFARWATERTPGGRRVRLIGEPPWALGHEARVRDWARHESVINVAFASLPVTFICPYDANSLPDEVLKHARDTHPELVDASGTSRSDSYEDPRRFCGRLQSSLEAHDREPSLEMLFGLGDLPAIRRLVGSFAIDAGLPGSRAEEIVLAVNEIATNAAIHGRPPSTLRAWHTDGELVVEVTDAGYGIRNSLAGQLPPRADGLGGRGLWLARLLCDAVEVCNSGGCTVTMHADAPLGAAVTAA